MNIAQADLRPEHVKKRFPRSVAPLVNGKALLAAAKKHNAMIMATNIRCRLPVEGIVRASIGTGAPVMYEIAKSELGYTDFTPASFVEFIVRENERLGNTEVPFAIHADHLTVKKMEDVPSVRALIAEEMEAGFTSFAIDASHMENEKNLAATLELARPVIEAGLSLEVELGEIGAKSGSAEGFTQPEEAEWFIGELVKKGIHPDLLAINNGSIHGTYFGTSHEGIQLDLTRDIWNVIQPWGVDIAQHGITGTSLEKITSFIHYGIRKGNVGTFWQNISFGLAMNSNGNAITTEDKGYVKRPYRGVPDELWNEMWAWAVETGNTGGNIKNANMAFAAKLHAVPAYCKERISAHAYEEAVRLFEATHSIGLADAVWQAMEAMTK
ncbi:class II fructose-bisphosphate aldolase [Desulfoglaeba alkanexedens]|uniref:Class II fructose-bisphosphate aldolase n=1 Tax=Desulfoglaeba alkanexedens ALDC TaxID=980445 RepID=A0A4P8L0X9_9BACT|nr:class II fructose-bisphosphate aldolase [Desulfoglaeba alkanexedens]QCQ21193.1 class II fructose-bisphosphate aldolase [Desulfoglaeba alkanexedens ALDC]